MRTIAGKLIRPTDRLGLTVRQAVRRSHQLVASGDIDAAARVIARNRRNRRWRDETALLVARARIALANNDTATAEALQEEALTRALRLPHPRMPLREFSNAPVPILLSSWAALVGSPPAATHAPTNDRARRQERGGPVLIVSDGNDFFLPSVREALSPTAISELHLTSGRAPTTREAYWKAAQRPLPPSARRAAARASVVFAEWCGPHAARLSWTLPPGPRLVIRLHAYEGWQAWPALVNWARVDCLVFASAHMRAYVQAAMGGHLPANLSVRVVPIPINTATLARPKPPNARWTVAMLGWAQTVKDPMFALEGFRLAAEADERWVLRLIGRTWDDVDLASSCAPDLPSRVESLIRGPLRGRVIVEPFTEDVSSALQRVGIILSTSLRESSHVAVAEGMASGAHAIVRRWPAFGPDAAAVHYPLARLVSTPVQLAQALGRIGKLSDEAFFAHSTQFMARIERDFDNRMSRVHLRSAVMGDASL